MEDTNKSAELSDSTTVEQLDVNIDELFGTPGAESVMLPEQESEKPKTVFSNEGTVDVSFIDKPASTETAAEREEVKQVVEETIAELDNLISQEEEAGNKGRPKVDKSGLYELATKMIEEGTLFPFDDDRRLYYKRL